MKYNLLLAIPCYPTTSLFVETRLLTKTVAALHHITSSQSFEHEDCRTPPGSFYRLQVARALPKCHSRMVWCLVLEEEEEEEEEPSLFIIHISMKGIPGSLILGLHIGYNIIATDSFHTARLFLSSNLWTSFGIGIIWNSSSHMSKENDPYLVINIPIHPIVNSIAIGLIFFRVLTST